MVDYQIFKHPHLDDTCWQFAQNHNLSQLAGKVEMELQILRNKLYSDQPRQLTLAEVLQLIDIIENSTLIDGRIA